MSLRSLVAVMALVPAVVATSANAQAYGMTPARNLQTSTASDVPFTLADNATELESLRQKLTTCKYSKEKECVNDPTSLPEFGEYKRGPGRCAAFDAAYIDGITDPSSATPNRYLPIGVEEANARGFKNKFSEWSKTSRDNFKLDCPLLYNETIAKGQDYLCCTEKQYGGLNMQVRMIPGLCSSCKENLRNVWCQMTCNPSNSMFVEINQVRIKEGDKDHTGAVFPAIEEATYFVGKDWIRDIYDFCKKDSSFALLCNPNQNCTDGYGLLRFMGQYKLNSLGSPLQINVKTMDEYPDEVQKEKFCSCGTNSTDCYRPQDGRLRSCAGVCGSVCAVDANDKRKYTEACYGAVRESDNSGKTVDIMDPKWKPFMDFMASNLTESNYDVLNYFLAMFGGVAAIALMLGFMYAICHRRKYAAASSSQLTGDDNRRVGFAPERRLSFVDSFMTKTLTRWGLFVATGKGTYIVLLTALAFAILCMAGLSRVEVETDPVKLWVAETSRPFKERDRYGELFMPFYRTEQLVMIPKDGGSISRREYLREAIRIQQDIAKLVHGPQDGKFPERIRLEDICWKATGTACTVNSITQYFQNSLEHFDWYDKYGLAEKHFSQCVYSPENSDVQTCGELRSKLKDGETLPPALSDCPCLSAFGAPMNLYNTYLGGFPAGADKNTTLYLESKAMLSTALVYNYYELEKNQPAIEWERDFINQLKDEAETNKLFNLYFMAEASVQDEIEHSSKGDILPIAMSYTLMILYVSLGINRWSFNKTFFVTSKVTVGFLGIVCIMLAVSSTIGIFMWFGAKLQLVIMEVVPFLTLAIGVDNIFLLVHAMGRTEERLRREQPELFQGIGNDKAAVEHTAAVIVSEAVGYIGPSIFMASFAESAAFVFGCISPMPAVLWFAAFSALAVAINWLFQMTILLCIMTLDKRRELSGNYDILCCVRSTPYLPDPVIMRESIAEDGSSLAEPVTPGQDNGAEEQIHKNLFDKIVGAYTDLLAKKVVKLVVLLVFLAWTLTSINSIENIHHGLPQAESMPSDSYLIDYFNTIDKYLATGPPVFFVVEGGYGRNPPVFDLDDTKTQAKFCKSKGFCDEYSIPKIVDALANELDGSVTHFAKGVTYSWMDDFWGFINPDSECCRVDKTDGSYLPIKSDNQSYTSWRKTNPSCLPVKTVAPPVPQQSFPSLFGMFATASAGAMCSYGGGSIYRGQFSVDEKPIPVVKADTQQVVLNSTGYGKQVSAFSYMVISTANPKQQDFIDAYAQARRAAEWISQKTGIDVWAYSLTYVFFDQYLTVVRDTYTLVGLALVAIFVIHAIYFGSIFYPLVVALACANVVIHVMGLMEPNDIMLNGLSMVNLIIAAGVSVEFCGHFVRMFAKASGTGDQRAKEALRKVLASVLFGITITKVVGLSMLTLADSRIFQKYYFRMYMMLVICGLLNGMVLLPVLLSVCVDVKAFFLRRRGEKEITGQVVEVTESPAFRAVETTKLSPDSASTGHSNSD
ncbi:hypothetical protein PINS_up011428 [Pythium insidiosum]|nr:hypothetical protein PINS_up011428 [Pythium insidiosum]